MHIRSLQQADLPALITFRQEQVNLLTVMTPRFDRSAPSPEHAVPALESALADAHHQIYLAEAAGALLGYLWLKLDSASQGHIVETGVELHGQSSAVGAALWSAARCWCVDHRVREVFIPQRDAIADAFWLAQGATDHANGMSITL
jgi:hypothetical protein